MRCARNARLSPSVKRILIAVSGGALLALGVVMLVLPGPGLLIIPAGLAVLGQEFAWARRWSDQLKARLRSFTRRKTSR